MWQALLWVYLMNAVLLIVHEIDSAYWEEWKLFHLPGGNSGFLLLHLPLVGVILYGLVLVERQVVGGLVVSLLLSAGGLFAFGIHTYFLRRGHDEFRLLTSRAILAATLVVSVLQAGLTVYVLAAS